MEETWNKKSYLTLSLKGREIRITGNLIILGLTIVAAISVPFLNISPYLMTFIMLTIMFTACACSWNIISGFTGYFSFGHVVFFGLGAYVGAILIIDWSMPWPIASIFSGFFAMGFAGFIAYPLLRLRGPYFSICTLGISTVVMILIQSRELAPITRGGWGISLPLYRDIAAMYYGMLVCAIAAFLFMYKVRNSKIGYGLIGIREDEDVAQFMGINTTRLKMLSFVLSSFFIGAVGAIYALYVSYIDAGSVFSVNINFQMITMAMFGGIGTIWGPVIGSLTLGVIAEYLWASFPELHLVILGGLIVFIVIIAPDGLMGLKDNPRFRPVLKYFGFIPWHEDDEDVDAEGSEVETSTPTVAAGSQGPDTDSPTEGDDGG
jgi:branched-chain amino acid transport system permease protein